MKADPAKLDDKMLRTPKCSRCRNHGFLVPVKGHAGKCQWKLCTCGKCCLITERQKIMAAHKMLKMQASEEEEERALVPPGQDLVIEAGAAAAAAVLGTSLRQLPLPPASGAREPGPECRPATGFPDRPPRGPSPGPSAFQPVPGDRGRSHVRRSGGGVAVAMPGSMGPQLGAKVAGRGSPDRLELLRPVRRVPSLPFADFGLSLNISSDCVVGTEAVDRQPSKLYPSHPNMHSYCPFRMGYQDGPPPLGTPLQRGFRHVSCSPYRGGGLVTESEGDFQPSYYPQLPPPLPPPQQPQLLPRGFLAALHFLPPPPPPPPPPSFSIAVLPDTDKETADNQDLEVPPPVLLEIEEEKEEVQPPPEPNQPPPEPSQPPSQEQSD